MSQTGINWSVQSSGVSVSTVRSKFSQTIATGIDEKNYKDLSSEQIRNQWHTARNVAGSKFILTPGCSVPNDSSDEKRIARTVAPSKWGGL